MGKLLIAKCQKLSAENIELRHAITEGKVAQAEAEASLQKQNRDELVQQLQGLFLIPSMITPLFGPTQAICPFLILLNSQYRETEHVHSKQETDVNVIN